MGIPMPECTIFTTIAQLNIGGLAQLTSFTPLVMAWPVVC